MLIARSLPGVDADGVLAAERVRWTQRRDAASARAHHPTDAQDGSASHEGPGPEGERQLAVLVSACGDSTTPAPPALGRQIDRMGRAGVNTALTDPFNLNKTAADAVKDQYNAAPQSQWASYAPRIAGNLAILDSLDTVCGNQILAGSTASAGRYNTLAGVLADDQIYVNTDSGTCTQYLAVEANAIGIRNGDCGGRTPLNLPRRPPGEGGTHARCSLLAERIVGTPFNDCRCFHGTSQSLRDA